MTVQLLNNVQLYWGNPEEDEHTLALTGTCARILGNGGIIIFVAATCRY